MKKTPMAINLKPLSTVIKKASRSGNFKKHYEEELINLRLAKQIRGFRKKLGMTQTAVAQKVSMPQSVIARIESGEYSFTIATLDRIANAFDKKIELK